MVMDTLNDDQITGTVNTFSIMPSLPFLGLRVPS